MSFLDNNPKINAAIKFINLRRNGSLTTMLAFLFVFDTLKISFVASPCSTIKIEHLSFYLALINRARGLYARILTEVVSTDRTQ